MTWEELKKFASNYPCFSDYNYHFYVQNFSFYKDGEIWVINFSDESCIGEEFSYEKMKAFIELLFVKKRSK